MKRGRQNRPLFVSAMHGPNEHQHLPGTRFSRKRVACSIGYAASSVPLWEHVFVHEEHPLRLEEGPDRKET